MRQAKEVVLGILVVVFNLAVFWFWFKAAPLIAEGKFQNYSDFIVPAGGLILSASLFSLAALFVKNKWLIYSSAVAAVGAPYLLSKAAVPTVGVGLASIALIVLAVHRIRKEYSLSLGFSLSKTTKAGLPLYFTVSSLIISIFYFGNITEEKALSSILPKPAVGFALKNLSGPLGTLTGLDLPKLNPEATIDEVLLKLVEGQLQSQGVAVSKLPRQEILLAVSAQREGLAQNFGIRLKGREKLGDVLYSIMSQRIEELLGPYKKYLPAASAIAFFLAFKTLTIPLYYVTILLTFALIKLMLAAKILKREKSQIETEKLTI